MKTPMTVMLFSHFNDARNALKLTYKQIKLQTFSGVIPRKTGRGGGERREGEGRRIKGWEQFIIQPEQKSPSMPACTTAKQIQAFVNVSQTVNQGRMDLNTAQNTTGGLGDCCPVSGYDC